MTTANKITVVRIMMIPAFVTMAIYYGESVIRGQPLEWQRFTAKFIVPIQDCPIQRLALERPNDMHSPEVWIDDVTIRPAIQ